MLQPKRTKFRKAFKGRIHGDAKGGTALNFGAYGLKAMEPERITARQIEAARRAITRHIKRQGRLWIRITCSGRLGGAEIARTEWYREGRVPLHTLRGNVDYAEAEAHTAYGVCGVKVWVFKGEILGHDPLAQDRLMMEAQTSGVRPAREERGNR